MISLRILLFYENVSLSKTKVILCFVGATVNLLRDFSFYRSERQFKNRHKEKKNYCKFKRNLRFFFYLL
ncbi:hypothetical protein SAMN05421877_109130 [Sphingobacterium lactis]|uniref:Uncharacterized protein n=1 Tax=Sphingobacterium lactis TaxID=797291 RepID=A0A1H6B2U1_9SPHI|nr:hypothetical protein SAMN05421877_109130 [Sphingobacterium lactis]